MSLTKENISDWFKSLQDNICNGLEEIDTKEKFHQDLWDRPEGGGGRSRVLENGKIIEKGGVNFSAVHGPTPDKILEALKLEKADFYATGVSIVLHPISPMHPIIHMNVRYFEMSNGINWFGGGIDVTPHYIDKEKAKLFHNKIKNVCDKHSKDYYPRFKKWADDYFYIKHRKETRGIGGIFFDRLNKNEKFTLEQRFDFVKEVGNSFVPIYKELVKESPDYGETEKYWQLLRRSRYVEFNLVYDKGTKFGLDTDGRVESILMSMPPNTGWKYNHKTEPNSRERETLDLLKKGVNWIDE